MYSEELRDKDYRDAFVAANVRNGIAFQIRALRQKAQLSQAQLAQRAGKTQNAISRLEDPDYGRLTVKTLLDLAKAFDVALIVKFAPYSELQSSIANVSDEALAVPSFHEEQEVGRASAERNFKAISSFLISKAWKSTDGSILRKAVTSSTIDEAKNAPVIACAALFSGANYGTSIDQTRKSDLGLSRTGHESSWPRHVVNHA